MELSGTCGCLRCGLSGAQPDAADAKRRGEFDVRCLQNHCRPPTQITATLPGMRIRQSFLWEQIVIRSVWEGAPNPSFVWKRPVICMGSLMCVDPVSLLWSTGGERRRARQASSSSRWTRAAGCTRITPPCTRRRTDNGYSSARPVCDSSPLSSSHLGIPCQWFSSHTAPCARISRLCAAVNTASTINTFRVVEEQQAVNQQHAAF